MEKKEEKISLEEKCSRCSGTGKFKDQKCPYCEGKGIVLTETGKALLNYIQDSIRLSEH